MGKYCKSAAVIREGKILAYDSVKNLGHTGVKRVSLKGISEIPEILGARDIKIDGDSASFLYSGDASALISSLAAFKFSDVNITDPELDEIFMHYYVKEEN